MAAKKKKDSAKDVSGGGESFKWTDDEAELLLKVTRDYKVLKAAEGVDWESVQSKYSDILKRMLTEFPASPDEAKDLNKDYPHKKTDITKQVLTTKLKAIRVKYRQAVDSGQKSGHERVVFLFFDLCESIWGGSPATEQIPSGLESTELDYDTSITSSTETLSAGSSFLNSRIDKDVSSKDSDQYDNDSAQSSTQQRRELLGAKLSNYKQEKLKRKLPVDSQLLNCAKEDIQLKKKLIDQMDRMDKQHSENMNKLSTIWIN